MTRLGWRAWALAAAAGGSLAAGCHGPAVRLVPSPACPTAAPVAAELPAVTPNPIEPDPATLPVTDPAGIDAAQLFAADPGSFRGLTEPHCRDLAAARSPAANLLDAENAQPTVTTGHHDCPSGSAGVEREARAYAARDARNRAAADALDRYYQLADAEARTELLALGLQAFDRVRQESDKLRAAGLPVPTADELLRQRAKLLADADQAEAGIRLLNIDLKARMGLPTGGTDRLWPTGTFAINPAPTDTEAAVRFALGNRPDLLMLRTLCHGLSAETLPAARDQLRGAGGLPGGADLPAATPKLLRLLTPHRPDPRELAEQVAVDAARKELCVLIAEREAQAAAEVRAAAVSRDSAARRVALARSRVDSWKAKLDDLKARGGKPAEVAQAEIEWYKARAELVGEVMAWHRARVKLGLATGKLD